jgi:hypothetical protein
VTEDKLIPLYGFVRGDTLGLLVLVRSSDSIRTLAESLAEAAEVRVARFARAAVLSGGRRLDPDSTVAAAGLAPLERVDLVPEVA